MHPEYTTKSKSTHQLLENIVERLTQSGFITDTLSAGSQKFMGVCRLQGIEPTEAIPCLHRRIDLRILPTENYWCGTYIHCIRTTRGDAMPLRRSLTCSVYRATGLLHFTGSDYFNRQMRTIALERGFTLSEYSICPIGETGVKGDPLPVSSEQDIFAILDLGYREPHERNL